MAKTTVSSVELTRQQDRIHITLSDGRKLTVYNSGLVSFIVPCQGYLGDIKFPTSRLPIRYGRDASATG